MPASLGFGFYQGTRSEYLAGYVLSRISIVNPLRRESDFGIDMVGNVITRKGWSIAVGEPFAVQVKSDAKPVVYTGRVGNSGQHSPQVRWLLSRTTPFVLATVDKKAQRVDVYSTWRLAFLGYSDWPVRTIRLIPGKPSSNTIGVIPNAKKRTIDVHLGLPFISVTPDDVDGPRSKADALADVLRQRIQADQRNLYAYGLGVSRLFNLDTNRPNSLATAEFPTEVVTRRVDQGLLDNINSALMVLGYSLARDAGGDYSAAKALLPALEWLRKRGIDDTRRDLLISEIEQS